MVARRDADRRRQQQGRARPHLPDELGRQQRNATASESGDDAGGGSARMVARRHAPSLHRRRFRWRRIRHRVEQALLHARRRLRPDPSDDESGRGAGHFTDLLAERLAHRFRQIL